MTRLICLVTITLCLISQFSAAADWPQWRGPKRDGISQEQGLLPKWPADGPKLAWQKNGIGEGYSTPAVQGERLYVMSNTGVEDEFVKALSTVDGSEIWATRVGKVGNPNQVPPFPAARSTPTVDGEMLYVLGSDGDIACVEAATGKIRWTKNVRVEFGGKPGTWAYAESPLVDGDVVVCSPGGADATMLALNKATGDVVWKCAIPEADDAGYASAIVVEAAGRKQYVQFLSKGLVGVDADSGKFLWRYDGTGKGPANSPTPVAGDAFIYSVASRVGGGLVELKQDGDGVVSEEVYMERGLPNSLGGSVLIDGHLYGTTREGLVCADFKTGAVKWENESVAPGSVCFADGRLYVHGDANDMALVEPSPEAYVEHGRFTLPDVPEHPRGGMEKAWTYPVVANGKLYIRDAGTIWCYDVSQTQ